MRRERLTSIDTGMQRKFQNDLSLGIGITRGIPADKDANSVTSLRAWHCVCPPPPGVAAATLSPHSTVLR